MFVVYLMTLSVTLNYTASSNWVIGIVNNWKGSEGKWSWPNLRHYPGIFLNELRETMNASVTIVSVPTEIRN
jgi:hypothetical protein